MVMVYFVDMYKSSMCNTTTYSLPKCKFSRVFWQWGKTNTNVLSVYGIGITLVHIQICNNLNQCSCNRGFTGASCNEGK